MANDLMKKVGELLDLAGLDKEVVKSVTEKLIEEKVQFTSEDDTEDQNGGDEVKAEKSEGAKEEEVEETPEEEVKESSEETVEESACPIKKEEEDDEDTEKAPVDPAINKGGILVEDFEALKQEYAKLLASVVMGEAVAEEEAEVETEEVEEAEEVDALEVLLGLVKEAFEKSSALMEDFEALKEEHAKLLASLVISEADTEEEDEEAGEKEDEKEVDEIEGDKEEEEGDKDEKEGKPGKAKKEDEEADKNFKKADAISCSAEVSDEETADKIAEGVTEVSEEAVTEEVKPAKRVFKAYSAFSSLNEAEETKEEGKTTRKAFTVFPNLK